MVTADVESVLGRYAKAGRDALIPILQEVQESNGYLSRDAIVRVGKHIGVPASKVYGVATFYNQFRFHPPGKVHIQVCRGTACHVKGSAGLLQAIERELGIKPGQTTRDGIFSLEVVACVGACGLAPVITVNGEFIAGVQPDAVKGILDPLREKVDEHDSRNE